MDGGEVAFGLGRAGGGDGAGGVGIAGCPRRRFAGVAKVAQALEVFELGGVDRGVSGAGGRPFAARAFPGRDPLAAEIGGQRFLQHSPRHVASRRHTQ